ncbi:protein argonaute 5 isoform X3 [Sesbania bispinosa]|nr:protein argonaute 5 isoform X3 [Sesbania bispinosa]
MEDYLLRNKGVFHVPVFKAASWDHTFKKDPGDCPEAGFFMFQMNVKSIFSWDNSTLCSSLRWILRVSLNRDVSASFLYEPGFGIVSTKPVPIKPSKAWLDQDHVKVKKAFRGIKVISFQRLMVTVVGKDATFCLFQKHVR